MTPKNHISSALLHLKWGVVTCALGVFLSALVQLLVFGFVHYTDIRFQTLESPTQTSHRTVVVTQTSTSGPDAGVPSSEFDLESGQEIPAGGPVDVNRVHATANVYLERVSQGAVIVGIFSAVALAVLTALGVVVAGGACYPGVDKAVSACTWGLVLSLLALPWQDLFASMPFAGVFTGYTTMVSASDGATGSLQLMVVFVGVPLVAMAGAMLVGFRFSSAVESGILAGTAPAPVDPIEADMAATRAGLASNRQLGSVRNDFKSQPAAGLTLTEEPAPRVRSSEPPARRRSLTMGQDDSNPSKRPI
ncbi:MAG TPA: hypothetical protein ENJ00_01970 [Phycisphaerales bacterium]|nr:hypothetical protein [Phycisphaerales bacterium]